MPVTPWRPRRTMGAVMRTRSLFRSRRCSRPAFSNATGSTCFPVSGVSRR
jgi:hypothetical protein